MKPFRLALSLGSAAALALALSGCLAEPSYSTTPEISANSIELIRVPSKVRGGQPVDSVSITINYQDGDGDLGLTSDERKRAPYDQGKFNKNYFIEPFVLNTATNQFVALSTVGTPPGAAPYVPGSYNGAFQRPTTLTDGKPAPIRGTLTYGLSFPFGDVFVPGQTVRFEISIADRALHVSNTIVTDAVTIAPR